MLRVFILSKSSCVTAFAAKFFHSLAPGEAIIYSFSPGARKNFIKALFKQITESHIAFMVKAAGHHRSITEHTYLIAQTITETTFTMVVRFQIRPVKLIARLKPELI